MPNKYTYSPPFTKEQLTIDYSAGFSQIEIAQRYKTTQKVVWKAMKNWKINARIARKRDQNGSKNHMWKGNDAGYSAFHFRVERLKGKPRKCEVCGSVDLSKAYDWANLTGRYEDPNDYKRMCRSCHWKHDKKINNILKNLP